MEQGVHGAVRHVPDRRAVLLVFRLWRVAGVEQPQEGAQGGPGGAAGDAAGAQQALKIAIELKKITQTTQGLLPIFAFYHHNLSNLFVNYIHASESTKMFSSHVLL
jgi:hypothetical protein